MTIREQIQTTLRALAEIPAVVELVREGERMHRTHVETALRLQLAKKQAHIERLQYRCSKAGADVAKALRDVAKWRDKCHEAEARAGEEIAKNIRPNGELGTWQETVEELKRGMRCLAADNENMANELGPARGLIAEQKRQLESCSARIRELETQALAAWRAAPGDVTEKPTMADLWRPIGDEAFGATELGKLIIVRGGDRDPYVTRKEATCPYRTHYIVLEPPR